LVGERAGSGGPFWGSTHGDGRLCFQTAYIAQGAEYHLRVGHQRPWDERFLRAIYR